MKVDVSEQKYKAMLAANLFCHFWQRERIFSCLPLDTFLPPFSLQNREEYNVNSKILTSETKATVVLL